MMWFEGSVSDAIHAAKRRSLVFVVVITGEDEQSSQLMSSWEEDSVSEAARGCCVAIRVEASSEACVQFSQIYPVVCVPSSFFIGESGVPLEVIAGSVSAEDLRKRIHRVKQMHAQQIAGGTGTDAPAPPVPSAAGAAGASLSSPVSDGSLAASWEVTSHDAETEEDLDSKVERLNKKLEEKREQRKKGEEETEIKKEMERRKVGKDMHDYKRKQEDDKTKRLLEERNREKAEEKAARERVKMQIAMDRADRAARYARTQEEEKASKEALLQARQAEREAKKEATVRQRSTVARIQFRLPDGSSLTNQFPSQSTLQDVRHFALQEVGNRYGNFSLATMFPRREFTDEDLNRTLQELELAPSASVVLLPHSGRPANTEVRSSSGGGLWAVLGSLLYPLLAVWRFLSAFLFTAPPTPGPAPGAPARQSGSLSNSSSSSSPAQDKTKRETLSKHSLEKRPQDFKTDGRVCSLRTPEDSEDENNTWNGNSTQQM